MAGLGDVLGEGSSAEQFLLWNVASGLVSAVLGPVITDIAQSVWKTAIAASGGDISAVLSPDILADLVVRNFTTLDDATASAADSGVNATDFALMVANAGNAPGPEALAAALYRGIITANGTGADSTSYEQGIAEGDTKDKWGPIIQQLALSIPSPDDVINSYVRGQISEADALTLYQMAGGDPTYFQLKYDTRGNPPSPTELMVLVRRGIIPQTGLGADAVSLQQGIAEGDTKDKWFPQYQSLLEYLPPPRTITALARSGVLSVDEEQAYYQDYGLSPALAAIYAQNASVDKVAGTKLLNENLTLELYMTGGISAAEATTDLNNLGYSDAEAAYMLQTRLLQQEVSALKTATTKVGTLYAAHKITRAGAINALGELGISAAGQANLMATWDVEATSNVALLTSTEIAQAFYYKAITQDQATQYLMDLGFTAFDAYIKLSNISQAALPDPPAANIPAPAVNP